MSKKSPFSSTDEPIMRHRSQTGRNIIPDDDGDEDARGGRRQYPRDSSYRKDQLKLPNYYIYAVVALMFTVFLIVIVLEKKLPKGLLIADENQPENQFRFISERAMNHLIDLTSLGPRVAGSEENDIFAVNFLKTEINNLVKDYNKIYDIEIEEQKSSGAFKLTFLDGLTNVYNDVKNIIVRVAPKTKAKRSLLFNCHFDSVPDSPGGSDDGAACCLMLELLRVLLKSGIELKWNIIFLWNGAEENIMQGSHGFVTNYKYAKDISVFLNLEAVGAGGREVLFQAGPKNLWLLDVYADSVAYPFASSLAQEIFQSGIIPAETDFRIFRDFGKISGVDFAWASNGYVYHTKYDAVDQIPLGSLQRTGDNMLAFIKGINNQEEVDENYADNLIYFDVLGAFVVRWHQKFSTIVYLCIASLSVFAVYKNIVKAKKNGTSSTVYYREVVRSIGIQIVAWIASFISVMLIGLTLTFFGRTMSWYAKPIWVYFLYVLPTLSVSMAVIQHYGMKQSKAIKSSWILFQVHYDATQILWTFLLVVTTAFSIRSGFIALIWVLFSALENLLQHKFFNIQKGWKWLLMHVFLIGIPFVQSFYLALGAITMFIPTMGRTGSAFNSELIIAGLICMMFGILFSFVNQLVLVTRLPHILIRIPASITFLSIAVLLLTNLGFPYSAEPNSLAPQRYILSHVDRHFYDEHHNTRLKDSGFWIIDMDINSVKSVEMMIPEFSKAKLVDCSKEIFCGMPYLLPVLNFIWKTHWIEAPPYKVPIETNVFLNKKTYISPDIVRMNFSISGPDHMNLMFSPYDGITLDKWSLDEEPPLATSNGFQNRVVYFVYYSYSLDPIVWNFYLDFKVPPNFDLESNLILDMSVNGHFMHGKNKSTRELSQLVDKFPIWTTVSSWASTIRSYRF